MEDIKKLLSRPRAYYNIDGVGELGLGFLMLSGALLGWLQTHTPREAVWHQVYMLFIYMGLVCSIIHYGSRAIKERLTYPRTGFVQYEKRNRLWAMALSGGVAGATAALVVVLRPHGSAIMGWLFGPLIAGGYAYRVAREVRWKWMVVLAMALGLLAIARLPATALGPFWLTFALYGILLLISGGVSLLLYVRNTEPPAQDAR